jgi:hypothetical protein
MAVSAGYIELFASTNRTIWHSSKWRGGNVSLGVIIYQQKKKNRRHLLMVNLRQKGSERRLLPHRNLVQSGYATVASPVLISAEVSTLATRSDYEARACFNIYLCFLGLLMITSLSFYSL